MWRSTIGRLRGAAPHATLVVLAFIIVLLAAAPAVHAATMFESSGNLTVDFDQAGADSAGIEISGGQLTLTSNSTQVLPSFNNPANLRSITVTRSGSGTANTLTMTSDGSANFQLSGGISVASGIQEVNLGATISAAGAVAIPSPVAVIMPTTLTSTTSINLSGTINGTMSPTSELFLSAPTVGLGTGIGQVVPLVSLHVTASTAPITAPANVTTSGAQHYAGQALRIAATTTLTASAVTAPIGINTDGSSRSLTISQSGNSTISGTLSGALTLTKSGTGNLTLNANNTYTGTTTASAGTLTMASDTAFGDTDTGTIASNGATLAINGNGIVTAEPFTLNGAGVSGTGALQNTGGDNVTIGPITLAAAATISVADTRTLNHLGQTTDGSSSFGLTKIGSGTLVVDNANPYDGGTTISAGTVSISNSGSLGWGAVTVSSGATLSLSGGITPVFAGLTLSGSGSGGGVLVNSSGTNTIGAGTPITLAATSTIGASSGSQLTISAAIDDGAGTFGVVKSGAGSLFLGGTNGYDGITTVDAGTLRATAASALGEGSVAIGAATVDLAGSFTYASPSWTLGASSTLNGLSGNAVVSGSIAIGGTATISAAASASLRLNGAIDEHTTSGTKALTIAGAGTITIGGSIGATRAPASVTVSSALSLLGNVTTTGTQTYSGTTTLADASTTLSAGDLAGSGDFVNGNGAGGTTLTIALASGADATFAGRFATASGTPAAISIVKQGGELELTGASTMTGTITVTSGDLTVNGTLPSTSGVIFSAGLLRGAGTIGGPVTIGGTAAIWPGNSGVGTLTTGDLTIATGLYLNFELPNPGTAGTNYAQIASTGNVNLGNARLFTLPGTIGIGDAFTVIHAAGTLTGQIESTSEGGYYQDYRVSYADDDLTLTVVGAAPSIATVAPETGSTAGGTIITITGGPFYSVTTVTVGGAPCPATLVSATTMTCTAPAHAAGAVDVVVTTSGRTATLPGSYTYAVPPSAPDATSPASSTIASPNAPPTTSPTARIGTPRYAKKARSITTTITAGAAGRVTQTITSKDNRKTVVRCSTSSAISAGKPLTLTCRLDAAARAAIKRSAVRLTVTTTYTPTGGATQQAVKTLTARR